MDICAVARGKIGPPLAVLFAQRGYQVRGADVNEVRVASVNAEVEPFPVVGALEQAGEEVAVHDPSYTDEELARCGWLPNHLGTAIDAVVVQADHEEYRALASSAFPGVRFVVNGRRVLDRDQLPDVLVQVIGGGQA